MKRLLLAGAALILAGCGWHGSGVVTQKDHDAAWVQITTQCTTSGNSTVCHPGTTYWPESWELRVRDDKGKQHWVDVSESEYSAARIGDAFSNGDGS